MLLVFTDVDGTLLDFETYEPGPGAGAVELLKQKGVPLIMASSKTRAELLLWQRFFGLGEPMIPENGGAVLVPRGYRDWSLDWEILDGFWVKRLSPPLKEFYRCLEEVEARGPEVVPITRVPPGEISKHTGLSLEQAVLAQRREFSLPFMLRRGQLSEVREVAGAMGFDIIQGRRFHHLVASDKGKAVEELVEIYRREGGDVFTAALGDNINDEPMLKAVDRGFLVMREEGVWDERVRVEGLVRAPGVGPRGFAWAVERLLEEVSHG